MCGRCQRLSYGVAGYTSYVFFTWFYLYLVNVRGLTKTAGGYWAGLPYVAVAVGTAMGGQAIGLVDDSVPKTDRTPCHCSGRRGLGGVAHCVGWTDRRR